MNINGILVPIVTPFDNNGNVDAQKLTTLVEAFIEKGVAGIVACGTTGEYYTFSAAERELVLTTIAEAAKNKGAENKAPYKINFTEENYCDIKEFINDLTVRK